MQLMSLTKMTSVLVTCAKTFDSSCDVEKELHRARLLASDVLDREHRTPARGKAQLDWPKNRETSS